MSAPDTARPHVSCDCHPGVRWTVETWGTECPLTAAIRRAERAEAAARDLLDRYNRFVGFYGYDDDTKELRAKYAWLAAPAAGEETR